MTSDIILYPILAVIGAVPLFFLVAAISRSTLDRAKKVTLRFLDDWANVAPAALRGAVSSILGFATGFALLVALAYGFDRLGNDNMKYVSRGVGHLNNKLVAWSVNSEREWKKFRDAYQSEWEKEHLGESWDVQKTETMGKWKVRVARTLFCFSLLLTLAGLLDLFSKKFRKRGLGLLMIGILATAACLNFWVNSRERYIREVIRQNDLLIHQVPKPASLNDVWG